MVFDVLDTSGDHLEKCSILFYMFVFEVQK